MNKRVANLEKYDFTPVLLALGGVVGSAKLLLPAPFTKIQVKGITSVLAF